MTNIAISAQERKHLLQKLQEQNLLGNTVSPVLHNTVEGLEHDSRRGLVVVEG